MSDYDAAFAAAVRGDKEPESPYDKIMRDIAPKQSPIAPAPSVAVSVGREINSIPRQIGLTARYGLEGLAQSVEPFTEPIRRLVTAPIARAFGASGGQPLGKAASGLADAIGLPSPQTANERVVGDATRLVAGAGGIMKAGDLLAKAPGMAGQVGQFFASNPTTQAVSAAGAGAAGGASREAGGDGTAQAMASVVGGLAAPLALNSATSLANAAGSKIANTLNPKRVDQLVENKIELTLNRAGINWRDVDERTRQSMRATVRDALNMGQDLNADAMRRLLDFQRTGLTPTLGSVTLDPVQITREKNLAKVGANSSDRSLQTLAGIENQNNAKLIGNINEMGPVDSLSAGRAVAGSVLGTDSAWQNRVSNLYQNARALPGGDVPLNTNALLDNINRRLVESGKAAFLPDSVGSVLDQIRTGVVRIGGREYPANFDATSLDNLMTTIATAQRGTQDGNVRAALSAIRQAINDTPITPVKNTFGGNQVVTEQGAQLLRSRDAQAGNFMDALNRARSEAAARFNWRESSEPVRAIVDGAEPDKLIKRFVIGGTVADAQAVAMNAPIANVRGAIVDYLKGKALNGAADEVGKFSQSAFNKAMREIGDEKMALFFTPQEIANLKMNGRVASYTQVQPVGSAVNNSNSGALALGGMLDLLGTVGNRLPLGLRDTVTGFVQGRQASQALNPARGLLRVQEEVPLFTRMGPALATGGLLATTQIAQ